MVYFKRSGTWFSFVFFFQKTKKTEKIMDERKKTIKKVNRIIKKMKSIKIKKLRK